MANSPQSEKQERHKILTNKFDELIPTLPKGKGWLTEHLFHFRGYWLFSSATKGAIFIQDHNFWHKPTDIILATAPKCGTNWCRALLFAIINRKSFDFVSHPLLTNAPRDFAPLLELFIQGNESIPLLETMPSPRIFSTHIAYSLFPRAVLSSPSRFVYMCRDPKDVFVSLWHFMNSVRSKELPPISLEEAFRLFCEGISDSGPFWDHVLEYWKASLEAPEKILFLKYEEMKRKPLVHVKRMAAFLGKPFSLQEESEGVVEEIVKLCSFQNLSNLEVNKRITSTEIVSNAHFFRKGEVGDWKNHLTPDMGARLDQITKEKLHPFGLSFA